MISCGYTTIEYCEKRREEDNTFHARMPYNRGFVLNMCAVLGYNPFLWFVPFCKCGLRCLRPPAPGLPSLCLLTACVRFLWTVPNYEGDGIIFKLSSEFSKSRDRR